jgi:spermidine synthase
MTDNRRVVEHVTFRGGDLTLQSLEGTDHFELLYNGSVFRSTYDHALSVAFADTILGLVKSSRAIDILLGGLGLGDTLQQILSFEGLRNVTVIEPDEIVLKWDRKHLKIDTSLDDARTELVVGNFMQYVEAAPTSYHGIGIDLDLGPTQILREESRRVYSMSSLRSLASRLRSDGVLVIRSTEEDRAYRRALDEVFSEVGVREVEHTNIIGNSVTGVFYVARM